MRYETGHIVFDSAADGVAARFEGAAGCVCGREHVLAGRGCQDAFALAIRPGAAVGVVCDGCGSSTGSAVGAQIGAQFVSAALAAAAERQAGEPGQEELDRTCWEELLDQVRRSLLRHVRRLALAMSLPGGVAETVHTYFLFTVMGICVTRTSACVFGAGDGYYAVNGRIGQAGPFPGNAPPYLAYSLRALPDAPAEVRFSIHALLRAEDTQSLLVATDGAAPFAECVDRADHGAPAVPEPLERFWGDDRYFRNPDALRRRLAVANRDNTTVDWEKRQVTRRAGVLRDDTAIVAIRRRRRQTQ